MDFLNPYMWLIKIVGVLAVVGGMAYGFHKFTNHYIEIGINKQYAIDKAANDVQRQQAFAMYVSLSNKYADRNLQITTLEQQLGVQHEQNAQLADRNHIALAALQLHWNASKNSRCGASGAGAGTGNSAATSDSGSAECESAADVDEFLNGILQKASSMFYEDDQYLNDYRLQRDERRAVVCH